MKRLACVFFKCTMHFFLRKKKRLLKSFFLVHIGCLVLFWFNCWVFLPVHQAVNICTEKRKKKNERVFNVLELAVLLYLSRSKTGNLEGTIG
jgi:hypothetical protein